MVFKLLCWHNEKWGKLSKLKTIVIKCLFTATNITPLKIKELAAENIGKCICLLNILFQKALKDFCS